MKLRTVLAVDSDKWACATYKANFPDVDVRHQRVSETALTLGMASIILAGFPCQPHSLAGKRLASADERDGGDDFVAAIKSVMPRMFLGENVAGIMTSEGGAYVQKLLAKMEHAGYIVEWRILDAVNYGAPQFRERVWFFGIRRDLYAQGMRHQWPKPTHCWPPEPDGLFGAGLLPGVTVGQALGIYAAGGERKGGKGHAMPLRELTHEPAQTVSNHVTRNGMPVVIEGPRLQTGTAEVAAPCPTIKAGGNFDASGHQGGGCPPAIPYRWSEAMAEKHPPASPASPAPTVQAKWFKGGAEGLLAVDTTLAMPADTILSGHAKENGGGADPITHMKRQGYCRRLSPLECARLMSAPDDFKWPEKISKTAMYRIIGNGQASLMVHHLAQAMAATDPESSTVIDLFCGGGIGAVGFHGRYWSYELEFSHA